MPAPLSPDAPTQVPITVRWCPLAGAVFALIPDRHLLLIDPARLVWVSAVPAP